MYRVKHDNWAPKAPVDVRTVRIILKYNYNQQIQNSKNKSISPPSILKPPAKVSRMSDALLPETARASVVLTARTPAAEDDIVPKPSRAPVAYMYKRRMWTIRLLSAQ